MMVPAVPTGIVSSNGANPAVRILVDFTGVPFIFVSRLGSVCLTFYLDFILLIQVSIVSFVI